MTTTGKVQRKELRQARRDQAAGLVRRILLVGAGHAHLAVLRGFAKEALYGARVTLVTPLARQVYSGMLPGVIAGHYRLHEAQVDIEALCARAYVEFAAGQVDALDLQARRASLEGGETLEYDAISLNPGSLVERSLPGAERTCRSSRSTSFSPRWTGKSSAASRSSAQERPAPSWRWRLATAAQLSRSIRTGRRRPASRQSGSHERCAARASISGPGWR